MRIRFIISLCVATSLASWSASFSQDRVPEPVFVDSVLPDVPAEPVEGEKLNRPEPLLKLLEQRQTQLFNEIKRTEQKLVEMRQGYAYWQKIQAEIERGDAAAADFDVAPHEKAGNDKPAHDTQEILKKDGPDKFQFEYEDVTWKTIFDELSAHGQLVVVLEYPPGRVTFSGFGETTFDQALILISLKLQPLGFALWSSEDTLRVVKSLPSDHPLLGIWEVKDWIQDGEREDDPDYPRIVFTQTQMLLLDDDSDIFRMNFSAEGQDLYWQLAMPDEETQICVGSFQLDGDCATILLAIPEDDHETHFIKLRRLK